MPSIDTINREIARELGAQRFDLTPDGLYLPRMGALAGAADAATLARLDDFATALGLAFQVRDDILDIEASSEQLGKTAGKDVAQAKSTYPALLGMDGAKAKLAELEALMREALAPYGAGADVLRALGELAIHRAH